MPRCGFFPTLLPKRWSRKSGVTEEVKHTSKMSEAIKRRSRAILEMRQRSIKSKAMQEKEQSNGRG